MDPAGNGGLLQAAFEGKRPSSKMMPFSMMNMISDFINAYVLGNIGFTSTAVGACATFLYNLHNAYHDIQSGRIKVAIVGASESPVTPEIVEGYRVMGALADDEKIKNMNGGKLDYSSACRPFGENCGFTLAEGSQFVVLFSDDIEILDETGSCSGVENYSRIMTRRNAGEPPPTLIDYFPKQSLLFLDESHVSLPQIRGMYHGDYSRKKNLVEFGFRLPSALDNRPLKFEEFDKIIKQRIYVSATPGDYEREK